jgi:hypothetical protein
MVNICWNIRKIISDFMPCRIASAFNFERIYFYLQQMTLQAKELCRFSKQHLENILSVFQFGLFSFSIIYYFSVSVFIYHLAFL